MQTEPRFRINAKQNAKGKRYFDATAEYKDDKITRSTDGNDLASVVTDSLGLRLLSMIKETEKVFRDDKRNLIGDDE